nr:hypothetical protein [Fodinicola feengrottensis]
MILETGLAQPEAIALYEKVPATSGSRTSATTPTNQPSARTAAASKPRRARTEGRAPDSQ